MTLGRAIDVLIRKYDEVKEKKWIKYPVAYALYQTWKVVDRESLLEEEDENDSSGKFAI